jgi:hypothetical protein
MHSTLLPDKHACMRFRNRTSSIRSQHHQALPNVASTQSTVMKASLLHRKRTIAVCCGAAAHACAGAPVP